MPGATGLGLWIGTMHKKHLTGEGSLYCINEGKKIDRKIASTTISNGLTWSLDNTRFYFIDSPTRVVQSYIYDEQLSTISFEKKCY